MKLINEYQKAIKNKFAIGAFNFFNMETLQAIALAGKKANLPVICAVSESALKYMGESFTINLFKSAKKEIYNKIYLHLDHGKSFEICKKATDLGFDSVMIDGSSLSFEENIEVTKKVVDYCHKKGVQVEGELGVLKGVEDEVNASNNVFTNPIQAKTFVQKTGVDSLAIAIGTSHGAYKFAGTPNLRFDILSSIENELPDFPLVLHGSSSLPQDSLQKFNEYGGELNFAKGIPEQMLKIASSHNIVKINVDTDLRVEMTAQIRKSLTDKKLFNPRDYLGGAKNSVCLSVYNKITNVFK